MPFRTVLFDFDGTLADSFQAISASVNHVRGLHGLPPLPEPQVRAAVGRGVDRLMHDLAPGVPVSQAVAEYAAHHPGVIVGGTRWLPGVEETLRRLAAIPLQLAVCSNKPIAFTRQLLAALPGGNLFREALGPEDVGRPKPDPAMLLAAAQRLSAPLDETLYVGDMLIDIQTARAAGMAVWLVPGGANHTAAAAAKPDRILRDFSELATLLG